MEYIVSWDVGDCRYNQEEKIIIFEHQYSQ